MPTIDLPRFAPVSLVVRTTPFDSPDWLFEPVYRGHRALLHARGGRCEIEPADGEPAEGLADLGDRVAEVLGSRNAVLDGLVVAFDRHGRPGGKSGDDAGFTAFAALDLLWLDGRDLRSHPLSGRKAALAHLLPHDTGPLFKIFSLTEHGRALFAAAWRMDLEGIVARRLGDPYAPESVWYIIPHPGCGQPEIRTDPFARREPARRHRRAGSE